MKRTRLVVVMMAAMVAAAGAGWLAGTTIQSPAEAAAQTAAPEPSPILVAAEMRELSTDIITRGTGRFGSPHVVSLAPSGLKPEGGIITAVPETGTELDIGDVAATVSGRPVFVLRGTVPSYRDLGNGMEGPDVRQLETTLRDLGFSPGAVDGRYDQDTEVAVTEMYESNGYRPVVASETQLADLQPMVSKLIEGATIGAGVIVPADEVIFLGEPPVRVSELLSQPGASSDGELLSVTDANIAIDTSVPIESAGLVAEGMRVIIDEPDLGITAEGSVSFVAAGPGTNDVDGFHVYFEVSVPDSLPNLINASVRLTIPTESTGGPVLAIPVSALTLGADGTSRVQVSHDGSLTFVTVRPGLSAEGFVEVTPLDGGLEAGDLVVIGFEVQTQ
ncbi:MAG: peptidoglycan-binding protein [Acidimicrobiia bacterium]|nr:peptidoglycan-binding protein [Acidimicrobiia bacterium]